MNSYYKKKKEEQQKFIERVFGKAPSDPADMIPPYVKEIYQLYPDVPAPHPLKWDENDTTLPQDPQWQKTLQNTAAALRQAAEVCDQLSAKTERTTPKGLTQGKNALLCAVHYAEDLVAELSMHYPLPSASNYKIAKSNPDLASRIPVLRLNSEDSILIWMPRLPSKKRGTDSMVFQELREMLWENDFAHINKWHCDIIHIYRPNDLTGILDADNYFYKPVIDAIALALRSKDSRDHFSYSLYNFPHETIKPGCYIHVYKREEKVAIFRDFEGLISRSEQP